MYIISYIKKFTIDANLSSSLLNKKLILVLQTAIKIFSLNLYLMKFVENLMYLFNNKCFIYSFLSLILLELLITNYN